MRTCGFLKSFTMAETAIKDLQLFDYFIERRLNVSRLQLRICIAVSSRNCKTAATRRSLREGK
jgi:hypothetical protein